MPAWQFTSELVVHDAVTQTVDARAVAGVTSRVPKFNPIKPMVVLPEVGTLAKERAVTAGESNEKGQAEPVPTTPETVILARFEDITEFSMYPTGVEHAMLVKDDQLKVKHMLVPTATVAVASTLQAKLTP